MVVVLKETAKILPDHVIIVAACLITTYCAQTQKVAPLISLLDYQEVKNFEIVPRLEWWETVYPSI